MVFKCLFHSQRVLESLSTTGSAEKKGLRVQPNAATPYLGRPKPLSRDLLQMIMLLYFIYHYYQSYSYHHAPSYYHFSNLPLLLSIPVSPISLLLLLWLLFRAFLLRLRPQEQPGNSLVYRLRAWGFRAYLELQISPSKVHITILTKSNDPPSIVQGLDFELYRVEFRD